MSATITRSAPINGLTLHYEIEGEGEPLLLLHGMGGAGSNWTHYGREELRRHHKLIIPDLRGHGRTANPLPSFSHRQHARDLVALLDHLEIARCNAIGLSMGGNTLLHLATAQPARLGAMVLVSAVPYFPEQARRIQRQISVETRSPEEWRTMRSWHLHGDEQIAAIWNQMRAFGDDDSDMRFDAASLAAITARTLIVFGDRDPLYPVEIGVELYRAIPRASLWVMPNSGHADIAGSRLDAFLHSALAFLRSPS